MAKETVPSDIRLWRVRIAANTSLSALEALAHEGLDDDAEAWVELADAYNAADCPDAASAAVDRALQLDPNSAGALSTMFDLALTAGDGETLHRVSEALAVVKPQWHQGPEHLGRSFARRGEAAAALVHAKRAVSLAPFCHNAWTGLAEASVVAGDLERAREATKRSLEIDDGDDDTQILNAALFAGDLEQALAERYGHLPALPFPKFVSLLRRARESL
jgi:tetratricopeptide (TPR) repeat protein